ILCLDLCKLASHQVESLVPGGFAKLATFANEGLCQPIRAVNVVPAKFPFYACGDAIRWPLERLNLQNVAIFRPNVEPACPSMDFSMSALHGHTEMQCPQETQLDSPIVEPPSHCTRG